MSSETRSSKKHTFYTECQNSSQLATSENREAAGCQLYLVCCHAFMWYDLNEFPSKRHTSKAYDKSNFLSMFNSMLPSSPSNRNIKYCNCDLTSDLYLNAYLNIGKKIDLVLYLKKECEIQLNISMEYIFYSLVFQNATKLNR